MRVGLVPGPEAEVKKFAYRERVFIRRLAAFNCQPISPFPKVRQIKAFGGVCQDAPFYGLVSFSNRNQWRVDGGGILTLGL